MRSCLLCDVDGRVARNAEFVPPYGLGSSMYIRPLLLGTGPELGLTPPQEFTFVVYVTPGISSRSLFDFLVGNYYPGGIKPVDALIMEDFDRGCMIGNVSYDSCAIGNWKC